MYPTVELGYIVSHRMAKDVDGNEEPIDGRCID